MKTLPLFVISLFLNLQFYGQTITGNVLNSSNGEPLIYATENTFRSENETYKLPDVIVSPWDKLKKVGTTSFSFKKICGWGGTDFGKGWEIGTKMDLGDTPKRLKEKGWMAIDLSKYNLVFESEIALSLEWIKIAGTDLNKNYSGF